MRRHFLILTLLIPIILQMSTAFAATVITGTVTEKRGDSVKVEFQPHETAAPAVGDKVEFSTLLQGIKVGAGTGEVTEVDGEIVWVKISDDRPRPKMTGIIQATGNPIAKAGRLGVGVNNPTQKQKAAYNLPEDSKSAFISIVVSGSAAEKAGLQKGDLILEFNGTKLFTSEDLPPLTYVLAPGAQVEMKIIRKGLEKRLSVILGAGEKRSEALLYYLKGKSFFAKEDHAEAVKWYHKAAGQGHAGAQNDLGWMYENGKGVSKDDAEAVKWYRKAAEQGYATAQNNLGVMYQNGDGVSKDDAEAVKWYRKAAEQGHATAQNNLGVMYEYGKGVHKDNAEAIKWYRKAATQNNEKAKKSLKRLGVK